MIHELYECKHSNGERIKNIAKRAILSIKENSVVQNRYPDSNLTPSVFSGNNFFFIKEELHFNKNIAIKSVLGKQQLYVHRRMLGFVLWLQTILICKLFSKSGGLYNSNIKSTFFFWNLVCFLVIF